MPVLVGKDYAFVEKFSWAFEIGLGDAFGLLTPERLVLLPYRTENHENVHGNYKTTTTHIKVDGIHPVQAVTTLLNDEDTTVEVMNQTIDGWLQQVPKGPICRPLTTFGSIRIYTGWIRRSVAFLPPEGIARTGNSIAIRPSKTEIKDFVTLLDGHPLLEFIK